MLLNGDAHQVARSADFRRMSLREWDALVPGWSRSRARRVFTDSLISMNPPEHDTLRRAITPHFTARRVQALHEQAERHCDQLLDDGIVERLAQGQVVDLHSDLTMPLAVGLFSDLFGVPEPDRPALVPLVRSTLAALLITADAHTITEGDRATRAIEENLAALAVRRRADPRQDLISALANWTDGEGGRLEGASLTSALWGLWLAGFETTVAGMERCVLAMLAHAEHARLSTGSAAQARAFIDEALRYDPPLMFAGFPSTAVRDVDLRGVLIPEGSVVHILTCAANRDPRAFPDPDRFDPSRDTSATVSFGLGLHYCLGAQLARMECAVLLPRLWARLPGLSPAGRPTADRSSGLRGHSAFPVRA